MPLFISSECVSAHTPDNLSSKVVFPWSTWPTMPMLSSGCMSFSFISSDSFLMRGIFLLFLLFLFISLGFCFLLFFLLFTKHVSKLFCSFLQHLEVYSRNLLVYLMAAHSLSSLDTFQGSPEACAFVYGNFLSLP